MGKHLPDILRRLAAMKRQTGIALVGILAAILATGACAQPRPGPAHFGPMGHHGPVAGNFRHWGPGPGYRSYGPRYYGHHHHGYWHDWVWPVGLGIGLIGLAAAADNARSTRSVETVYAPPAAAPVNITINSAEPYRPQQDYYYCPAQRGYYPTVPACPSGWVRILPNG